MGILWIGKRFYTSMDTLHERFGRIYQLPFHWQQTGQQVLLWLVDYHNWNKAHAIDSGLTIVSTPVIGFEVLRQIFKALFVQRMQCIVASGDCYIGLLGWVLARLTGAKFVFDVYDKYDEFSGYRRFVWFDPLAFLIRRADGLIFASHVLAKKLIGNSSRAFHIAYNGIDPAQFRPRDNLECRHALKLPDTGIFIGYFGSMELDRGITDLVAAVSMLRSKGLEAELLLAGVCAQDITLDSPWIRYLGMVPHRQVPLLINACDVLVVPYRNGPYIDMVSSCKIAEYLACQRPLVSTDNPGFLMNFPQQAVEMGPAICRMANPPDMARALAYQLKARAVPSMADDMHWQAIAQDTLSWLRDEIIHGEP